MRTFVAALLCSFALGAQAQWLDSTAAREFRDRVVQLALIYGDSSGIDLEGFKVAAREVRKVNASCSDVEVTTAQGEKMLRRETVRACRVH